MYTLNLTTDEMRALKTLLTVINEGLECEAEEHALEDTEDAPFSWIYDRVISQTKPPICCSDDEATDIATGGFEGMLQKVLGVYVG